MTTDNRIGPPSFATEREMLAAFLDYQRATLVMKCDGLTDDELRQQSSPPSTLSLLALIRHLAEVERAWFRRVFDDPSAPMVWSDQPMDFQAASTSAPRAARKRSPPGRPRRRTRVASCGTRSRSTWPDISPGGTRKSRCGWS